MITKDFNEAVKNFSNKMKSNWQILFIIMVIMYSASLYHSFKVRPLLRDSLLKYAQNLDILSFIIAIVLAIVILNLKRRYFSKRFSRKVTETSLKNSADLSDVEILKIVFAYLQKKIYLIWFLGFLIVLDGIILYWIIYLSWNMHIYFIVGTFSLILNYPRQELFFDIPWYIVEARKEFRKGNSS
jgi:hypothetical protein